MRLAVLLALLATPSMSDVLSDAEGLYRWDTAEGGQCTMVDFGNADIEITGNTVQFTESRCTLTNPTALRDMPEGTLYDAACNGEGELWSERMLVYKTYTGIALISRGAVRTYSLCQ